MRIPVSERLRVVQVGLGDWGRDWAWRVNPTVPEVEIVGYVDSNPAALALISKRLPEAAELSFPSVEEAIESTRPDALLVTTTLAGHEPLTRAGLEAGLHVLVEKPFTDDLDCARELVELAQSRGRTLMVSQNYRFFPAARTAARLVAEGGLGDLYEVAIDFRRNDPSPPKPLRRHHILDTQPLLIDMAIHHFDLLRLILGREPRRISCQSASPPWSGFAGPPAAEASIDFEGVLVSYRGSWISAGPQTHWSGEWTMEFQHGQVWWTGRGDRGVFQDRVVVRPRSGRPRALELPEIERLDRAGTLTEFATALREGREPETSGRDNLKTLAFTLASVESAARGSWIDIGAEVRDGAGQL